MGSHSSKNHPKGDSFFFLKFSDTRFNSHSMVSLDVMIQILSLNSLSRVILMNFLESKFNSLSHPVIPSYPCSVNKESWPTGGRYCDIESGESRGWVLRQDTGWARLGLG